MKNKNLVSVLIVIGVVIIAFVILKKPAEVVSEEVAKCIGANSKLYVQLGCQHCETQEKMFGSSYEFLNTTDCWFNRETCSNLEITGTPTWVINNQKYVGVQTIEKLRELTGC